VAQVATPRRLLVAVDADRSDPATVQVALARAARTRAEITLMCVWRPSRLVVLAVLNCVDPDVLRTEHEQAASDWFRARVADVPDDVSVRTVFLRGRLRDQITRELGDTRYDELIVDPRLSVRDLARVRRVAPGIAIRSSTGLAIGLASSSLRLSH
jgi:Universal stress protein family